MHIEQIASHKHSYKRMRLLELVVIAILAILVFVLAGRFDLLEKAVVLSYKYEKYELDELIAVGVFLAFAFVFFSYRRLRELKNIYRHLVLEIEAKEIAQNELEKIKEIIPICASCKSIRDDEGFWMEVETYIHQNSDVRFSHGICPGCAEKLYPELRKTG